MMINATDDDDDGDDNDCLMKSMPFGCYSDVRILNRLVAAVLILMFLFSVHQANKS